MQAEPKPERYECDNCGACCKALIIEVYDSDVLREPRLAKHVKPFKPSDVDDENPRGLRPFGLLAACQPCPFLTTASECGIYTTRPLDCVLFEPGGAQCQETRGRLGFSPLKPTPNPEAQR